MLLRILPLSMLLLVGCARHLNEPSTVTARSASAGSEYQRLPAQRYTPADWPQPLIAEIWKPESSERRAAVLVVHGGGWERRSPDDMERICRYLAEQGFVVVNVAYRFAPEHRWPAQLEDLKLALQWMGENAAKLGIDVERIGGLGYSSGAHLVSMLALQPAENGAPRIRAVVAGGSPIDLTRWPNSPLVTQLIGGSYAERMEAWKQASPLYQVDDAAPPFFLYHGGMDWVVEPEQSEAMFEALQERDVHAELYISPLHGHVSMFLLNRSAIRRGAAFLQRQLAP